MRRLHRHAISVAAAAAVAAGAGALAYMLLRSVRRRRLRLRAPLVAPMRKHGCDPRAASGAPAVSAERAEGVGAEQSKDKSRAHVQFGRLLFKSGRLSKAISHFERAVALNGRNARAHFELAEACQQVNEPARAAQHYERVLELKPACVEAATNLAVAYLAAERCEESVRMSRHAIALQAERARGAAGGSSAPAPINSEAFYNLNSALRACGRAEEAHERTWEGILMAGGARTPPLALGSALAEGGARPAAGGSAVGSVLGWLGVRGGGGGGGAGLSVVCVKWGSKYGPEYVNKLHAAVRAHCALPFAFICYTDDPAGLDKQVELRPLEGAPGWDGWWLKACLFGPGAVQSGRVAYLDLDTIVVGPLDELFSYQGPFATLAADEWACERDNASGVNSSVMLWDGGCAQALAPIHGGLLDGLAFRHLLRFDHWLEMLLPPRRPAGAAHGAAGPPGGWRESLQERFAGQVVEYRSGCARGLPEGARLVCFPRSPKPHQVTDEWAQQAWHRL